MGGASKSLINLLRGWPAPSLLPATALRTGASAALSDPDIYTPALQYGPDWGYEPLREQLAKWLGAFYEPKDKISADRLCITGGASQSLAVILAAFTDPLYTRNIWMVAPTYFLACPIFHDAGFYGKLRAVPEDPEGIDISYLRQGLQRAEKDAGSSIAGQTFKHAKPGVNKFYKHLIYCVPTFSNPSATTMSLSRRVQLVEVAREFDALLVSDDVYDFLQWPSTTNTAFTSSSSSSTPQHPPAATAPQPRLVDIDASLSGGPSRPGADGFGNAASNGSFSKIVAPGVRCGWIEATPSLAYGVSQTGAQKSGGAPSQLTSAYITQLLTDGTVQARIAQVLIPAYERRWRGLMRAVDRVLGPLGVKVATGCNDNGDGTDGGGTSGRSANASLIPKHFATRPTTSAHLAGGYFVYLRLPPGTSAKELSARCKDEENLIVGGGPLFVVAGDEDALDFSRDVRLCFSWEDEDAISEGVERMGKVLAKMLADCGDGDIVESVGPTIGDVGSSK